MVITEDKTVAIIKFGALKWLEKFKDGEISFSCPGRYIDIAKKTGNNEQGDEDEGIFARLQKDDIKIEEMKSKLKDDLEIIDDGNYVKLRRISSYYTPTFCFYGITVGDILKGDIKGTGFQRIKMNLDSRIFNAFTSNTAYNVLSNENAMASLSIFNVEEFRKHLALELFGQKIRFSLQKVNYVEMEKEEFFIEPTYDRKELFYKRPQYSYQNEYRICLTEKKLENIYDRFSIKIKPVDDNFTFLYKKPFGIEFGADVVELP